MIVCSCNVLTDHDIRLVMSAATELPRTTHQVYGCLGCRVECGRCVGTIRAIMNPACDKECLSAICHSVKDHVTRDISEKLMKDEESHIDFLETQIDLVKRAGLELYSQRHIGELGDS